jgi:hypothetical protein
VQSAAKNLDFLWQAFQDRLQTRQQLKARNWRGSERCCLCGSVEDVDHLLFRCPLAEFVWACMGEALDSEGYPRNMNDLLSNWLPKGFGVSYQLGLACFAGLAWVIWTVWNKICMQKKIPNSSIDLIYSGLSFIQKWKCLMRSLEKTKLESMLAQVIRRVRGFRPSDNDITDVGFL